MHCECSYHLAEKKIPSIHGGTMGLKLEQFIFDAFPYAPSTALFEVILFTTPCFINPCSFFSLLFKIAITEVQVPREEEFAPVKNANGSNFDTPESARLLVLRLQTRWVVAAGGFVTHSVPLYATGNFMLYFACLIIVTSWKISECL
jgi:UDP-N-acetylglucosamine/UDP-N-acetylgalactosamine diphosphorylase